MFKKIARFALIAVGVLFLLLQFIPVKQDNPPVTQEITWDSAETEALARRACYDCHSNETVWPWYSYIAPVSLLTARDVNGGRRHLNFSQWDQPNEEMEEIIEVVKEGEMPLAIYLPLHPEAKFTEAELSAFITGLETTLQNDPPIEGEGEHGDHDDH